MANQGNVTPNVTAVIGQSGGPTAVINQSLVGVVQELRRSGHVKRVLGAKHGVRGITAEAFVDLDRVSDELLERVANTPAAALGSTRDKPDHDYCERIFRVFAKNDVRYFFYIGGNDSADTARIVSELARKEKYDLQVFHIPKTIDNDLKVHDHCPGYGSAARFVANAMLGDNFDNRSLPGIKIDVIMGRNAGFLTAASVLARQYPEDGPHLIYIPEQPITTEQFVADVEAVYTKRTRCLIAVSEGVTLPDGRTWAETITTGAERDAHGNLQLAGTGALGDYMSNLVTKGIKPIAGKKLRVRADTFGYLQRSFPGCVSPIDAAEAREVGIRAARYSKDAGSEGSVAMRRGGGEKYAIEYFLTPLASVAKETKHMDPSYFENRNNITQAFIDYASPFVGNIAKTGWFEEMRK